MRTVPLRRLSWSTRALSVLMADAEPSPRLAIGVAARLPAAWVVITCVGPDCAAALADEVRPGNVYVLVAVPNTCWLGRVTVAPAPNAAELTKPADALAPMAEALFSVATE